MPKKNGIIKTFSFDKNVVLKLNELCKVEHRTQTNLLELLIIERYEYIAASTASRKDGKNSRIHITVPEFEELLEDGFGARSIASFFGCSTVTLTEWVKQHYDGKTFKELYLERRAKYANR